MADLALGNGERNLKRCALADVVGLTGVLVPGFAVLHDEGIVGIGDAKGHQLDALVDNAGEVGHVDDVGLHHDGERAGGGLNGQVAHFLASRGGIELNGDGEVFHRGGCLGAGHGGELSVVAGDAVHLQVVSALVAQGDVACAGDATRLQHEVAQVHLRREQLGGVSLQLFGGQGEVVDIEFVLLQTGVVIAVVLEADDMLAGSQLHAAAHVLVSACIRCCGHVQVVDEVATGTLIPLAAVVAQALPREGAQLACRNGEDSVELRLAVGAVGTALCDDSAVLQLSQLEGEGQTGLEADVALLHDGAVVGIVLHGAEHGEDQVVLAAAGVVGQRGNALILAGLGVGQGEGHLQRACCGHGAGLGLHGVGVVVALQLEGEVGVSATRVDEHHGACGRSLDKGLAEVEVLLEGDELGLTLLGQGSGERLVDADGAVGVLCGNGLAGGDALQVALHVEHDVGRRRQHAVLADGAAIHNGVVVAAVVTADGTRGDGDGLGFLVVDALHGIVVALRPRTGALGFHVEEVGQRDGVALALDAYIISIDVAALVDERVVRVVRLCHGEVLRCLGLLLGTENLLGVVAEVAHAEVALAHGLAVGLQARDGVGVGQVGHVIPVDSLCGQLFNIELGLLGNNVS